MAFLRSLLYILDFTPTKDKISFICDDEEQMALPFYQMYRKIQRIWPGARDRQAAISFVDSRVQEPYQTMFTIAWCTGLRAGELLALTVEDLDFSSRTIIVNKSADDNTRRVGPTKTNTSTALLPKPSALESRLRTYLEKHWRDNPSKLLFPNRKGTHPLWRNNVVKYGLKPVLRQLKILTKFAGLHAFRHGLATELADKSTPIPVLQQQMRHADVRTTLKVYAHVILQSQRDAMENVSIGTVPVVEQEQITSASN
jgi:integrase